MNFLEVSDVIVSGSNRRITENPLPTQFLQSFLRLLGKFSIWNQNMNSKSDIVFMRQFNSEIIMSLISSKSSAQLVNHVRFDLLDHEVDILISV